jgi:hypothetical protein
MARNLLGEIPDSHFENEPTYPAKNVSPLSEEMVKWIEKLKREVQAARLEKFRDPKYHTGGIIGPF